VLPLFYVLPSRQYILRIHSYSMWPGFMSGFDFVVILLIVGLLLFWWDSLAAREVARRTGRQICDKHDVQFLDDTVSIMRIRLRRNTLGQLRIYRAYHFEYSYSGEDRGLGEIEMLGRRVINISTDLVEF